MSTKCERGSVKASQSSCANNTIVGAPPPHVTEWSVTCLMSRLFDSMLAIAGRSNGKRSIYLSPYIFFSLDLSFIAITPNFTIAISLTINSNSILCRFYYYQIFHLILLIFFFFIFFLKFKYVSINKNSKIVKDLQALFSLFLENKGIVDWIYILNEKMKVNN